MKKVVIVFINILLIVLLSWQASAAIGVSPGSYIIDAQPGLKQQFIFSYSFDNGVESEIYAEGDLAEYVTLSTNKLIGSGAIIANLELPESIDIPGDHKLFIGARQVSGGEGGGVGIVGNVRGVILVKVPYPGKYAIIKYFETTNANRGDPINLTLRVDNLGKESINAEWLVEVYDTKNNSVGTSNLGSAPIEPTEEKIFFKQLETKEYQAGDYRVVAKVNYEGGELKKQNNFRLGTLYVGISNYTKQFQREKINQFYIEVESFWNDPIENVYADVEIVGHDIKFLTPSTNLQPWSKDKVSGFFDTTGIEDSKFKANITINYAGKKTSQIVNLKLKSETDYVLYALIGGGIFLAIIVVSVITLIIILLIRVRKNESIDNKKELPNKNVKRIRKEK